MSDVSSVSGLLQAVDARRQALAHAKSLYQERLAPDFSPFEFIPRGELQLSKIVGWLANPRASHGQGSRFLQILTHMTGDPWSAEVCDSALVYLEFGVGNGRLDILIRSGKLAIAIENKPWADDQPDQLRRYFDFLDNSKLSDYRLLYLTADGSGPSSRSLSIEDLRARTQAKQLVTGSYRETLLDWLDRCRAVCRADRVSTFLDEISRAVRKEFEGIADMSDLKQLTDVMMASPESIASSMVIANANAALKTRLLESLENQFEALISRTPWTMTWNISPSKLANIIIDFDPASSFVFSFEFSRAEYNELAFGIVKREHGDADGTSVRGILLQGLGHGEGDITPEEMWPWWRWVNSEEPLCPLPNDWAINPEPWASIPDSSVAATMFHATETVIAALGGSPTS